MKKLMRTRLMCACLAMALLCLAGGWAPAASPRPPRAKIRPGELIVRFRPGAAPETPASNVASKPGAPQAAFAFAPAAKLAGPNRPASLKALDRRFGLREGRALGAARNGAPVTKTSKSQGKSASATSTPSTLQDAWLLRLDPSANLDQALAAYRQDPAVLYAEPNYEGALAYIPTDPLYTQQSADFKLIGLERAWDLRRGANAATLVAVIDSGVDAQHPDLKNALDLANSYNFPERNTRVFDDIGHGTRVAGIIGATCGNGEGIVGVAYGCKLMSLDVASTSSVITSADVVSAVDWAVARGADVINLSIAFRACSQALGDACRNAVETGVVVVAAAGNEGQGELPVYPASYEGVLGVGAVTSSGARCPWSNYNGTCKTLVDLVAPGETIFSTIPKAQYNGTYGSGTSFAAPLVSGVAALLKARYPLQSGQAIASHLLDTASPVGSGFTPAGGAGAGMLNAANALAYSLYPKISIEAVLVDDAQTSMAPANDGNGRLGRGEKARLRVRLKNAGADASQISATLVTNDSNITLGDPMSWWNAIGCGASADPVDLFTSVTVASGAAAHIADFALAVTSRYNENLYYTQTLTFQAPVEAARTVGNGNYFTPQTWTADKTYEVLGTQNFNAGLTIEPGTTVKVAPGVDLNINGGALKAEGAADKPILFQQKKMLLGRNSSPLPAHNTFIGPRTEAVNLAGYPRVVYVSARAGKDVAGGGSASAPFASLKFAIAQITNSSAASRCAVLVGAGVYPENRILIDKNGIDLYGGFNEANWSRDIFAQPTLIDGQGKAGAVLIVNGDSRIDGFKIANAGAVIPSSTYPTPNEGGGIYSNSGVPVITNNVITRCASGGVCLTYGITDNTRTPVITNNLIIDNPIAGKYEFSNGGILIERSSATIERNVIVGNLGAAGLSAWMGGNILTASNIVCGNSGGVTIAHSSKEVMSNSVVARNYGGVMFIMGNEERITNCLITENRPAGGSSSANIVEAEWPVIENSVIFNNKFGLVKDYPGRTVQYSNIEGGYTGAGNIDADPKILGPIESGDFTRAQFDPLTCQTTFIAASDAYPVDAFAGRLIQVGSRLSVVVSNQGNTFTVWGDLSAAGAFPLHWEIPDFHLAPSSPCIDAGAPGASSLTTDLDGATRVMQGGAASVIDMGPYELDPAKPYAFGVWGGIALKSSASGSSLAYCTFEDGRSVLNQANTSTLRNCTFRNMQGIALQCASGTTGEITSCTFERSILDGVKAPGRTLTGCLALQNGGIGLDAGNLVGCRSEKNAGDGIKGSSATDSAALNNGGAGLNLTGQALRCHAEENLGVGIKGAAQQCEAVRNGGIGIAGAATQCYVFGNGGGGVSGSATDCRIIGNAGYGVSGSATVTRCEIRDNSGAAAVGARAVTGCAITGNGAGLSVGASIRESYIAANNGAGVSGGAVADSSILGNAGAGLKSPASVNASWVMFNKGIGIDSPLGAVTSSSICSNGGYGIFNPAGGKTVSRCNIYGNAGYEVYNNLNTASGGYPANTLDFRRNFWGTLNTPALNTSPFPSNNIPFIYDLFDNGLTNGWYVNYGARGEFETSQVNLSGGKAPAFLLGVTPDPAHPVNIGLTTFTLVFSRPMNTARPPSVTFGLSAPYTTYVVAPAPGWVNPYVWQGSFAVQSDTAEGVNTLHVGGAVDATGFAIPDDTAHSFTIEATGKPSANNGLAVGHGIKMAVTWPETGKPATALGYNVLRAKLDGMAKPASAPSIVLGGLEFTQVNAALITRPSYEDANLEPNTAYCYIVYLVDAGMNAVQWTPPFIGITGEAGGGDDEPVERSAAHGWQAYR